MTSPETANLRNRSEASRKEGLNYFMLRPETKLIISLIPPSEHNEVVRTLIESAFNAGFSAGSGVVTAYFLDVAMKKVKD